VTRKDAAENNPKTWNAFLQSRNDDTFRVPGGGESYEDLWDRAVGCIERMAAEAAAADDVDGAGGRIAVVTHGGRER
jgi:probable phosphoglycerate mutase